MSVREIDKTRAKQRAWSARSGACPIPTCRKAFRSDDCPHSVQQVDDYFEELLIRAVIRDELGVGSV